MVTNRGWIILLAVEAATDPQTSEVVRSVLSRFCPTTRTPCQFAGLLQEYDVVCLNRRSSLAGAVRFLRNSTRRSLFWTAIAALILSGLLFSRGELVMHAHAEDDAIPLSVPGCSSERLVTVDVANGDELQRALNLHAGMNQCVRISTPSELTCVVREDMVGDEKSIHGNLVPEGVRLDLNGATLCLDLRSNSYGVRLSSHSAICNGTIRIVGSEGKGSQSCWHSGISLGAAYGDGGTPEKLGRFSTVSHWAIENVTIDQPFAAAAIQLMSEACHGVIRNVRILDSAKALMGIGLDWGSVGPITTEDKELLRMRQLWEQGKIYSTHPHDVLIENVRIGKLLRNVDANDAGVRTSACHRITIRNIDIDTAATAVMIVGGDLGYEFAREDQRDSAHAGYIVDGVRIENALRFGLVLNGLADNIWRSRLKHGYEAVRDPAHPGLDRMTISNVTLHGKDMLNSQGIYAVSLSDATLDRIKISNFAIGVHVEDWVRGMRFQGSRIIENKRDILVEGATEPAIDVVFETPQL